MGNFGDARCFSHTVHADDNYRADSPRAGFDRRFRAAQQFEELLLQIHPVVGIFVGLAQHVHDPVASIHTNVGAEQQLLYLVLFVLAQRAAALEDFLEWIDQIVPGFLKLFFEVEHARRACAEE